MEYVPLIYIRNEKTNIDEIDKDKKIYIFDVNGVKKDKPNLKLCQKLSREYETWIDSGPREPGDLVDLVMSGAEHITIRKDLFPINRSLEITELSECKIYICINIKKINEKEIISYKTYNIDGVVVFTKRKDMELDFKLNDLMKKLCQQYDVYVGELDESNFAYWEKMGVKGMLTNIKIKENDEDG